MKQTLLFTLLLSGLFASNPSTNVEMAMPHTPKNIGHFIFPMGISGGINQKILFNGYAGMGYQTKIRDNSYIQSMSFEFGSKCFASLHKDDYGPYALVEASSFLPKISLIRYLNSKAENRLFFSAGPYLSASCKVTVSACEEIETQKDGTDKKKFVFDNVGGHVAATAGAVFGIGIEFGHSYGALNILRLEYLLPVKHVEHLMDWYMEYNDLQSSEVSLPKQVLNKPIVNITYAVGF
ncbi:MAG: hypothetical protein SP1CHLAM9_04510 [Chlamydiia bacterium]|nr:hypothetical protein [Chlamydiia bacterium]